mmetsp:Transcript_3629/g.8671  ORF Transcript_3629/g.8671 Transcript_3629/m.8671 type:complete len:278 (-) Transcript_3629:135-968(-)
MGDQVYQALCKLAIISRHERFAQFLKPLYFVTRLYVASLGYLVQEVLSDVSDLKRNHNLKFWLGADEAISEGRDLLSALGPCSEAAWSLHKRLLEDVTQIALNPDEATRHRLRDLLHDFRACKKLAVRVAVLSCVDCSFHLRKSLSEAQYLRFRRRRVELHKLEGFPRFRGMRVQILAYYLNSFSQEELKLRLPHTMPSEFPVARTLFVRLSGFLYRRYFLRHLKLIESGCLEYSQEVQGNAESAFESSSNGGSVWLEAGKSGPIKSAWADPNQSIN